MGIFPKSSSEKEFDTKQAIIDKQANMIQKMIDQQRQLMIPAGGVSAGGGAIAGGYGGGGGGGLITGHAMAYPNAEETAHRTLAARMNWSNGRMHPFTSMHVALSKNGEKAFVFVLQDDKYVVIEDDSGMFPCDATVTKLRMLQG
jgi:hypothetical protein